MIPKALILELASGAPLPELSQLKNIFTGFSVTSSTSYESITSFVETFDSLFALLINTADKPLFQRIRKKFPLAQIILVTRDAMATYSGILDGEEELLVDHVIAQNNLEWVLKQLTATVQKLQTQKIFGPSYYLSEPIETKVLSVFKSAGREAINKEIAEFIEHNNLPRHVIRLATGISEEFQMNAIFDAPNAGANEIYGKLSRQAERTLNPEHAAELQCTFDGSYLALSIKDPFGAMTRSKFFEYIKKVLRRDEGAAIIDTKEMGAGLGLFKIFYSSHAFILNVEPQKTTEMIALIDIKLPLRDFSKMARSLQYFVKGNS